MRIAYLTQPYPPMVSGASIMAEQLAKGMANRGHEVLVIAASESGKPYIIREKNLTVLRLASICNPMRVGQFLLKNPRHEVLKALREFKPDVIHTHEPVQMGWLGLEYARRARIPVTLTTHQLPWFIASYLPDKFGIRQTMETILWKYAGFIVNRFTMVISPTRTITNIIESKTGVVPRAIPFGIDLMNFHPPVCSDEKTSSRRSLNLPLYAPVILHVGRLDPDKSADRVIRASVGPLRRSNAHLLIVGDGCQKSALIHLCRSLGVDSRVHFTGFISDKTELAKIYRASDVFITASEIETQGIAILEAAASGLPIVAVRATCIPEVVHHGSNGYLAGSGDLNALSTSLHRILEDAVLANAMSWESRLIAEKYGTETTLTEHEKLYTQMIQRFSTYRVIVKNRLLRRWKRQLKQLGSFNR